jgi:hypothetical protein
MRCFSIVGDWVLVMAIGCEKWLRDKFIDFIIRSCQATRLCNAQIHSRRYAGALAGLVLQMWRI